jgi:hypothetical protein
MWTFLAETRRNLLDHGAASCVEVKVVWNVASISPVFPPGVPFRYRRAFIFIILNHKVSCKLIQSVCSFASVVEHATFIAMSPNWLSNPRFTVTEINRHSLYFDYGFLQPNVAVGGIALRAAPGNWRRISGNKYDQAVHAVGRFLVYWEGRHSSDDNECHIRFEIFTALAMKNAVFWDIKSQFVRHMRHVTSPPWSPIG